MTDHTRKERETINDAFRLIEYEADTWDHSASPMLREALAHERKQRSSTADAKALLVECFFQGARTPTFPALDLYGYSRGCLLAVVMGAAWRKRQGMTERLDQFAPAFEAAKAAHEASIRRALEEIRART